MDKVVAKYWELFDKHITNATVAVLKAFQVELSAVTVAKVVQFFKFGMAGLINTIAYYVVYSTWILSGGHYTWANLFGYLVSVLSAFVWNYKFVFKAGENEKRNKWRALLRTYVIYGFTGLIINNILLYMWIDLADMSDFLAPLINLFITVPINFVFNKFWACRGDCE